ncbi:hypothetical protein G7Y89_g12833 [Cudoniella acicularis]|uniref:Uncharacterized protein n=1 Tax=Cudoniella acicularis TaxID=354080 RepID=A0A8H4VYT0_9HELO|nr:hypothetical protein G7Y89_g12833 [Cudoniella acicularis]
MRNRIFRDHIDHIKGEDILSLRVFGYYSTSYGGKVKYNQRAAYAVFFEDKHSQFSTYDVLSMASTNHNDQTAEACSCIVALQLVLAGKVARAKFMDIKDTVILKVRGKNLVQVMDGPIW